MPLGRLLLQLEFDVFRTLTVLSYENIILLVDLHGCETWFLARVEEHKFVAFESKIIIIIIIIMTIVPLGT
jgi:hypothetical protein